MITEFKKINSNKVKSIRVKHNEKQAETAERLGININTYCQKEKGNKEFTLSEAKTLAEYFGESIDSLFFGN